MNKKDLDALNELYSSVYSGDLASQEGPEVLSEAIPNNSKTNFSKAAAEFLQAPNKRQDTITQRNNGMSGRYSPGSTQTSSSSFDANNPATRKRWALTAQKPAAAPAKPPTAAPTAPAKPTPTPAPTPAQRPTAAPIAPVRPAASAAPKPAASSANPMDTWARSNPGLARKVANSSTPQAGKDVISARVNADNDRGPSTPTPSSSSSTTSGSSSSSGETDRLKKALDIKKSDVTSSYQWPSAKTIRDIAGAYASIYEAKKKDYDTSRDKDGDGDNDFADNMIARMVASGMSREEAIKKVKNKSYNEEIEYIEERDEGKPGLMFKKIAAKAAKKYGSKEAGNRVAGAIRKKVLANEATAMAKRGHDETAIRNKIAKSTGGGDAADRATALANKETFGRGNKAARQKYAATQRGDFRDTTSSNSGLHGYAHKSNDPAVKAKQAARGAQRSALTPREKKQLNREAYEAYEFVASYLLENNFASTVDDANVIINNMSENWFASIMEEKKPLPVAKMKRKESKLLDNEEGQLQALRTDFGSKERKARIKELERFDNINGVRTSVAKRGGKQQHPMPEVGRFKPKDED